MTFYRKAKFFIAFDCEDKEGNVHKIYDGELREWDVPDVEFLSKREAYDLGGELKDWSEKTAKTIAEAEAKGYCGDETFKATNIDWDYSNEEEWGDCELTASDKSTIKEILKYMKEYITIKDFVEDSKRDINTILEERNCNIEDIKSLIDSAGLSDQF